MPGDIYEWHCANNSVPRTWVPQPAPPLIGRYQPSVEDDMQNEIVRLRTEVATLKATLGMVRAVLAQTVENLEGA